MRKPLLSFITGKLKKTANLLFSKYVVASIIATIISTFIFWIFVDLLGILAVIVNPIVSFVLFILKFIIYEKTLFFNQKKTNFLKYILVWVFLTVISTSLIYIFVDLMGFWVVPVSLALALLVFVLRFIIYKALNMVTHYNLKNIPGNYYDKHHAKNPLVRLIMNKFHRDLFSLIKKTGCKSLLDAGCGEGYTTKEIKEKLPYLKIYAIDIEEEVISIARKDKIEGIVFEKSSIDNIAKPKDSFCLTMATEVLEHLHNPEKAIEEMKRVSKKYCIFTVPNEPFFRLANVARFTYLDRFGNTPGHVQNWNFWKFKKLLKKHFKKVDIKISTLWTLALCEK